MDKQDAIMAIAGPQLKRVLALGCATLDDGLEVVGHTASGDVQLAQFLDGDKKFNQQEVARCELYLKNCPNPENW